MGEHSRPILQASEHSALKSNTNWLNVCEFLEDKRKVEFYPRGYPMNQRWKEPKPFFRTEKQKRKIIVNAGLWLDDPDVDAITRLTNDISAVRYTKEESFTMQKGTWCPFNSQNTAMAREMIPAYCLSPNIGRYDDIWAGSLAPPPRPPPYTPSQTRDPGKLLPAPMSKFFARASYPPLPPPPVGRASQRLQYQKVLPASSCGGGKEEG